MRLFFLLVIVPALAQTQSFWVWDLTVMPPGFRKPEFHQTHQDPSQKLKLYVEASLNIPASSLNDFFETAKNKTSLLTSVFGEPQKAGDLNFLLAAIPPYTNKQGKKFGFDGFFNVFDQLTEQEAQRENQHSNEQNIIYLNALEPIDSNYMKAVWAHELTHLLTYGKNADGLEPWINEMLGEASMMICGYYTDVKQVERYLNRLESPVATNDYKLDYGALSLFAEFLIKRNGPQTIARLSKEKFEKVYAKTLPEVFSEYVDWLVLISEKESGFHIEGKLKESSATLPLSLQSTSLFVKNGRQDIADFKIRELNCEGEQAKLQVRYYPQKNLTAFWVDSKTGCAFELDTIRK